MESLFRRRKTTLILLFILLTSFLVRTYNLNYSSPFNDEAIYIVLGRLGVFQWDWWSYNALAWMPGLVYIYPTMTAIAYMSGGIVGSRLLNVIFGILAIEIVFIVTKLLQENYGKDGNFAAILSAAILGGAPVAIYVSRLATFDMPSFYFFLLGIALLLYGIKRSKRTGKWYFISALFLYLSFLTKIIVGIYFPLIIAYSFFASRQQGKTNLSLWKWYFLYPLLAGLLLYFVSNFGFLKSYAVVQASREKDPPLAIAKIIWENSSFVWIFFLVGSVGMIMSKDLKRWLALTLATFWALFSHLVSQRRFTLEKHTLLAVIFISIIGGIGINAVLKHVTSVKARRILTVLLTIGFLFYWVYGYKEAHKYNEMWQNATEMLEELPKFVGNGDKVLAEIGAPAILATYEKNFPANTTTFDWFEYKKLQGEKAYELALKEGYFDLVELDGGNSPKDPVNVKLHNLVRKYVEFHYDLVYSKDGFLIFLNTNR